MVHILRIDSYSMQIIRIFAFMFDGFIFKSKLNVFVSLSWIYIWILIVLFCVRANFSFFAFALFFVVVGVVLFIWPSDRLVISKKLHSISDALNKPKLFMAIRIYGSIRNNFEFRPFSFRMINLQLRLI